MEEAHRTHKEPAWGWVGLALSAITRLRRRKPRVDAVTPWSRRSPAGWSA
jgi:MYXO-CTERM domain-containing protein